jgi:c-di-AMP phosphodiesterase-like protein
MSPRKHSNTRKGSLSVDLRVPFAITVAEGILLLGLVAMLALSNVPRLPLLTACILIFYLITAGVILLAYALRFAAYKKAEQEAEELNTDIYHMFRSAAHIPYAVINADGVLRIINNAMQEILGFHSPVCSIPLSQACPGVTVEWLNESVRKDLTRESARRPDDLILAEILPAAQDEPDNKNASVVRLPNGRRYRLETHLIQKGIDHYYFVIFHDVTQFLDLREESDRSHMVLAYIILDNLQELTQFVRANYRTTAGNIPKI